MQFPWKLLENYNPPMNTIGAMMRHEYGCSLRNLYCCQVGDVVEIGNEYYAIVSNWAYDVIVERLSDGTRESMLPTTACQVIGNVHLNNQEYRPC